MALRLRSGHLLLRRADYGALEPSLLRAVMARAVPVVRELSVILLPEVERAETASALLLAVERAVCLYWAAERRARSPMLTVSTLDLTVVEEKAQATCRLLLHALGATGATASSSATCSSRRLAWTLKAGKRCGPSSTATRW